MTPAIRTFIRRGLALWLALGCACCWATGIAVIVNPASGVDSLSREEVSHLFLGRIKNLSSGLSAVVIDTLPQREAFYQALLGRGITEIDAYWARLRFSGRTQPPLRLGDANAVLERVAHERGAIGYVDSALVDRRVKTVLRLDY
jgi:ABC-type phosphate transport system substrate-binding protein